MKITVYDIARELNIAQSTVSKALTGYSSVSEETRKKVLETAKRLGYEYNRNASSLARGEIKIGVTYPDVWHNYYSQIVKGIDEAIALLRDNNVSVVLKKFSSLYSGEEMSRIIDEFIAEGEVKGVLLFPSSTAFNAENYKKLDEANLAYVVVANELQEKDQIPCVHIDSPASGKLAAELLSLALPKGAECAVIIGTKDNREHLKKLEGFIEEATARGLRFIGEYCAMDDPDVSYETAEKLLTEHPNAVGVYVVSGNSFGVCQCIEEKFQNRNIKLIGTDIFKDIVPYLEKGVLTATIYQSPSRQGKIALTSLYDRIISRKTAETDVTLSPFPLFKSNYKDFL